ncbi:MAG TPA: ADYC domain-containing protein [Kofleriaceae bacterium]|nr:ADYC domain-containing protein [Kofleriaceae bacterium]
MALVALAWLPACVDDSQLGTTGLEVHGGDGEECPKLGCGTNSAHLGPTEFHELDETGVNANAEGFRLASFTKNGVAYRLDVTGTTLTGKHMLAGQWVTALSGQDLVGADLTINGANGFVYDIRVSSVSTKQPYWQGPAGMVNTYELIWKRIYPGTTDWIHVCNDPPNREDDEGKEWAGVTEAILFNGDRYDTSTLSVTATGVRSTGPWFNIGCSGTVLAKLALNRHTDATATPSIPTTRAQRQAMLKMYTSDVCGTGQAFTKTGTPLRWWTTTGLASMAIPYSSMEARWDENGAQCLTVHRLHGTFDDMDSQIADACAAAGKVLLPCGAFPPPYYLRTVSQALP